MEKVGLKNILNSYQGGQNRTGDKGPIISNFDPFEEIDNAKYNTWSTNKTEENPEDSFETSLRLPMKVHINKIEVINTEMNINLIG